MNALGWTLLGVALLIAAVDWYAVATGNDRLRYVAKPATMVPIIAAAVAVDAVDSSMQWWFVAALVFSLFGDVFLMLPSDRFVEGLGSFLVGHVLYVVGLIVGGVETWWLLGGAFVTAMVLVTIAPTIVKGASEADRRLGPPVTVYILAIGTMMTFAAGSGVWVAMGAAALFCLSDALIGWTRFVAAVPNGQLAIIVTYHLAQMGFVLSLTVAR